MFEVSHFLKGASMTNMTNEARILAKHPDLVGECPTWDAERQRLLWTDNRSRRIYAYRPASGSVETILDGTQAYAFTLQRDGSLLLFLGGARVALAMNGEVSTLLDGIPGEEHKRFNDVCVDSAGRVLCGLLGPADDGSGALYSLSLEAKGMNARPTKLYDGLRLPNGMALSADERLLYLADTWARKVLVFDYDPHSGAAARPREFIDFSSGEGGPDGITLDAEGCLWVAVVDSWTVARYAPDGTLRQSVRLPARKPTSVAFGGEGMKTLFITSASRQSTPGEEVGPAGGALFGLETDTRGNLEQRTDWRR